jgi:hypothetical protein
MTKCMLNKEDSGFTEGHSQYTLRFDLAFSGNETRTVDGERMQMHGKKISRNGDCRVSPVFTSQDRTRHASQGE